MIDVKKVQEEAKQEILEEQSEMAKKSIKVKMKEIAQSKKITRNLEHELEVLIAEIGDN